MILCVKNGYWTQNRVLFFVSSGVMVLMFLIHVTRPMQNSIKDSVQKKLDLSVASAESYGFFDDVPSKEWSLMKERVSERENHNDKRLGHRSKVVFLESPAAWYQVCAISKMWRKSS